jgi:hypothetical protein
VFLLHLATSEPSKVPWYIAGLVLAGWAVVLAVVGLRRPAFPGSQRGERGVIAISLVLVVIAVAMAIVTG